MIEVRVGEMFMWSMVINAEYVQMNKSIVVALL